MRLIIEPYENRQRMSEQALRHDRLVDICSSLPQVDFFAWALQWHE